MSNYEDSADARILYVCHEPAMRICSVKKVSHLAACLLTLLVAGNLSLSAAQTATASPTPSDEELRLQEEKRLLDLQKAIAEDKKAIRDAQPTPASTPAITPLAGDTTLSEGVRLETEMVSYAAMSQIAAAISRELKTELLGNPHSTIAVYDAQVIKDWRFYQALRPAFQRQVEDLVATYRALLCEHKLADKEFKSSALCGNERIGSFSARVNVETFLPTVPTAFSAGAGLLKSFIDFAALFRTDTKIEGKAVTIEQTALVAEVFRALKNEFDCRSKAYGVDPSQPGKPGTTISCEKRGLDLYYPGQFPPRLDPGDTQSTTVAKIGLLYLYKEEADKIIKRLNEEKKANLEKIKPDLEEKSKLQAELNEVENLTEKRDNLMKAIANEQMPAFKKKLLNALSEVEVELAKHKYSAQELKELIKPHDENINDVRKKNKEIDDQIRPLTEINDRFQVFIDQFVKVDEGKGINALALFVKAEDIDAIMNKDESYWLEIKSASAGGNNRTRKNLIWFFTGARIDHSGGAILEYTLYDKEGKVVLADKLSYYKGYLEPKKIRNGKLEDAVKP